MPVSLSSPDIGNLYVGKGIVSFMLEGTDEWRDVGEVREAELTLEIEELEHFTQRAGTRSKDLTVVLEKSGSVRFIMEEFTPENLKLYFIGGTIDENAQGGPIFDIMAGDSLSGKWRFVGTNDVGPNYTIVLDNVRIRPEGSINLISEEWGGVEVTAEMLLSQETGKFGTVQLTNLPSDT